MRYRGWLRIKLYAAVPIDPLEYAQRECHNASRSTKRSAVRLNRNLAHSPMHRLHNNAEPNLTAEVPHAIRKIGRQL
jgi:hypothetical protein